MIDPFCGSASFSCHAMYRELATEYIINDAYTPIMALLQAINDNHEELKAIYGELCTNAKTFLPNERNSYIQQLTQDDISPCRKAALWLFLANRLANNRPLFAHEQLVSFINEQSVISYFNTCSKIDSAHALLSRHKTSFLNLNARDLFHQLDSLDEEDFVILDPPYPGFSNPDQTIFFCPLSDEDLYKTLLTIIHLLNEKKVTFILGYDLFFGHEKPHHFKYCIDTENLSMQHLVLVSHNPTDPEFDTLFEHIYVSNNLELDMNRLPKGFFLYESIKNLNYEDAKKYVTPQSISTHNDNVALLLSPSSIEK